MLFDVYVSDNPVVLNSLANNRFLDPPSLWLVEDGSYLDVLLMPEQVIRDFLVGKNIDIGKISLINARLLYCAVGYSLWFYVASVADNTLLDYLLMIVTEENRHKVINGSKVPTFKGIMYHSISYLSNNYTELDSILSNPNAVKYFQRREKIIEPVETTWIGLERRLYVGRYNIDKPTSRRVLSDIVSSGDFSSSRCCIRMLASDRSSLRYVPLEKASTMVSFMELVDVFRENDTIPVEYNYKILLAAAKRSDYRIIDYLLEQYPLITTKWNNGDKETLARMIVKLLKELLEHHDIVTIDKVMTPEHYAFIGRRAGNLLIHTAALSNSQRKFELIRSKLDPTNVEVATAVGHMTIPTFVMNTLDAITKVERNAGYALRSLWDIEDDPEYYPYYLHLYKLIKERYSPISSSMYRKALIDLLANSSNLELIKEIHALSSKELITPETASRVVKKNGDYTSFNLEVVTWIMNNLRFSDPAAILYPVAREENDDVEKIKALFGGITMNIRGYIPEMINIARTVLNSKIEWYLIETSQQIMQ